MSFARRFSETLKSNFSTFQLSTIAAVAFAFSASAATTYSFTVDEGQTKTVAEIIEENSWAIVNGDTFRKMGLGTLKVDAPVANRVNVRIDSGVYYVTYAGNTHESGGGNSARTMRVLDRASLNLTAAASDQFWGSLWTVEFVGEGSGEGDNLGAICVGGNASASYFGKLPTFKMTGDATIYSYGTMNAIFSGVAANPCTLNMNGHALTLKGKSANSVFRPRLDLAITNAGPIIVRNGQFARHLATTTVLPHNIPLVSFKDGAKMAAYNDGANSLWNYVDAFEFEAGTKLCKGNGSPSMATMTLKKVIGPAEISDAEVTIAEKLVVRGADIAAGYALTSSSALAFGEGCVLDVDGFGGISLAAGTVHTVALSSVSITGLPALSESAARFFTIASTGTAITLTVKSGVVDVVNEWGVQAGEENAAANAAAVAAHIAQVGDGDVLYVPAGEYWFSDAFDLSPLTARGVTVWNPERNAVFHSGIAAGAASSLAIDGIVFSGCPGPAVVATGTAGLSVTNCAIDGVVGAYAGGNYPFAAVNVTDFCVSGCDWTAGAMSWNAQGYFDGGTQSAASEAYDGAVVVKVAAEEDSVNWATAKGRLGIADGVCAGKQLRKIGPGEFKPNSVAVASDGIRGVEVVEGSYVASSDAHFGVFGQPVKIHDGASLTIAGDYSITNRSLTVSGAGLSADHPAVRNEAEWATKDVTWRLDGNTTMYASGTTANTFFNQCLVYANGHTLTLKGDSGGNFRFRVSVGWYGGGTVVVDGISILSSVMSGAGYRIVEGDAPLFVFKNGAKFRPNDGDLCRFIKNCLFEHGTEIAPATASSLSFLNLGGAPAASANATAISVSGVLSLSAADVAAGRIGSTPGTLTFGANATWQVDDPAALSGGTYPVFTAAGGITGRPQAPSGSELRMFLSDANTLAICPKSGFKFILR